MPPGPPIRHAVLRQGERWRLTGERLGLIDVILAYAFTESAILSGVMYVVDHVLFHLARAGNAFSR